MSDSCVFCGIARGEIPAERLHDEGGIVAFRDANPQAPIHILIIPAEHVATAADLTTDHGPMLGRMMLAATRIAGREGLAERGYRLVVNCREEAGQSVFHLHLHLLGGRRMQWPPG